MGLLITRKAKQEGGVVGLCVVVGRLSFREQEMNEMGLHERSPSVGGPRSCAFEISEWIPASAHDRRANWEEGRSARSFSGAARPLYAPT